MASSTFLDLPEELLFAAVAVSAALLTVLVVGWLARQRVGSIRRRLETQHATSLQTLESRCAWFEAMHTNMSDVLSALRKDIEDRDAKIRDLYETRVRVARERDDELARLRESEESRVQTRLNDILQSEREEFEKRANEDAERRYTKWQDQERDRLKSDRVRIQREAAAKSRQTQRGMVAEAFVPLDPAFPGDPRDARFLGTPIDYVVFRGLQNQNVTEIVFVEVKTGKSRVTALQESVKRAVVERHVQWVECHLGGREVLTDADTDDTEPRTLFSD